MDSVWRGETPCSSSSSGAYNLSGVCSIASTCEVVDQFSREGVEGAFSIPKRRSRMRKTIRVSSGCGLSSELGEGVVRDQCPKEKSSCPRGQP